MGHQFLNTLYSAIPAINRHLSVIRKPLNFSILWLNWPNLKKRSSSHLISTQPIIIIIALKLISKYLWDYDFK